MLDIVIVAIAFVLFLSLCLFIGTLIHESLFSARDQDESPEAGASPFVKALASSIPQLPKEIELINKELRQSGRYERDALTNYLAVRNLGIMLALITTVACGWLLIDYPQSVRYLAIGGGILAIAAYSIPRVYIGTVAENRIERIRGALPDAMDMASMCLVGGVTLKTALGRVRQEITETHPDIASEFAILERQAAASSMGRAMTSFAERTELAEAQSLASVINQTERLGTNVAVALKEFSDNIRRNRRREAEEKANRTTVQIMIPVIFFLAPPIYIMLCGPAVLGLVDFFEGKKQMLEVEQAIADEFDQQ
ncbi:MAG: type II secretion system F family protein [Planctomycetota bacterium]|jgi:tight adherence protein C